MQMVCRKLSKRQGRKMKYGLRPIVASSGRSGTTVLLIAIKEALKPFDFKGVTTKQIQKTPRWNHATKTHGFPPKNLDDKSRLIFIFGNPYNSVYSYLRIHRTLDVAETFIPEAIRLTAASKLASIEDICVKDIFQAEKRFDAFYQKHPFKLMTLRYETMWKHQETVADFLEISNFRLPEFYKRESNKSVCSAEENKQILTTYKKLKDKIDAAEDIKIW